ncbi:ABC transporter permease [uncultured Methanomethylovorans sp.]|uniref:ABC transporter permease n=1 Tax=uncultured Methanomethylovorans sp. TaxID=183759 RepID=UPI002AA93F66|nr:ABC transporter permease [uncultured Methanomethylovorans sp.]
MQPIINIGNMYAELAKRNLQRHNARTILATIGIIIGVIAISSTGILGNSLKLSVTKSLGEAGNEIILYPAYGESDISEKQINQVSKIEGIERLIPILSNSVEVTKNDESTYATIYGIGKDDLYYLVEIDTGRFFSSDSKDCVIGSSLAESLNIKTGDKITFEELKYRVVGILKEEGFGVGISPDNAIFVTPERYINLYDDQNDGYTSVVLKIKDIHDIESVKESIDERLNKKEDVVEVLATDTMLKSINTIFTSISLFLMGIGSISLLVAGVGILNVMLMSAMERTKEIGIMKAVGASRNDILKMFILEALFLGILASLIGGVLSFGVGLFVDILILKDISYLFMPSTILYIVVGIAFGILTSLVGGVYPAWKASKMHPLNALRYD